MEITAKELAGDIYKHGTAGEVLVALSLGAKVLNSSEVTFGELGLDEQASIYVLKSMLAYLTNLGVLEDVKV
jgi:hypothetical protein